MAPDTQNRSDQSMTSLVSGIVSDFQELLKQQLRLTRQEVKEDLRKAKEATWLLVLGVAIGFLAAIPLLLGVAHLLHNLSLPHEARDQAALPLWGCLVLVGACVGALGAIVAFQGKHKLDNVKPLAETAQALKENLEWQTTPK